MQKRVVKIELCNIETQYNIRVQNNINFESNSYYTMTNHLIQQSLELQHLTIDAINLVQNYLERLGYKAQIHFELEGCYRFDNNVDQKLDFSQINQCLRELDIEGEIVGEYWRNQWEYVSLFNGQTPLKEAHNLHRVITRLPQLFQQLYGKNAVIETLIQPVVWSGDQGKLISGSSQIFTNDTRAVHIPNAVQLNVSVLDSRGNNLIVEEGFGEYLQNCFLRTSLECCLLYLPEEAAFERLALKTQYGLAQELCSPVDISGGHQGSIALYKKLGKHNQNMGEEPLLYDSHNNVLSVQQNWQKTARIEHRLGAASIHYNPYINVLYGLINVLDTVQAYEKKTCLLTDSFTPIALPSSLFTDKKNTATLGALDLFKASTWFSDSINFIEEKTASVKVKNVFDCPVKLGDKIQQAILAQYQKSIFN
ncbi:hypothetical protein [Candidatus Colwellia aromaticivorans]|uniref:hypothetical protein n=1 Tax=Candidatus Colwellia aromaticivorans TaxID=2267621 RepID=UPI001FE57B73|nr:hypothetical protein [Candidatus Colwellia aromaticivorans]